MVVNVESSFHQAFILTWAQSSFGRCCLMARQSQVCLVLRIDGSFLRMSIFDSSSQFSLLSVGELREYFQRHSCATKYRNSIDFQKRGLSISQLNSSSVC